MFREPTIPRPRLAPTQPRLQAATVPTQPILPEPARGIPTRPTPATTMAPAEKPPAQARRLAADPMAAMTAPTMAATAAPTVTVAAMAATMVATAAKGGARAGRGATGV